MITENSGIDMLYYKVMSGSWRWISYSSHLNYYIVDINENLSVKVMKEFDEFIVVTASYSTGLTSAKSIASSGLMNLNDYYDQEKCKKMYKLIKKAYKALEKGDEIKRSNKFPQIPDQAKDWSDYYNVILWNLL